MVVVVGTTVTSEGITERHRVLAHVIEAGREDVFVREEGGGRVFSTSRKRALLVDDAAVELEAEILRPEIGNLVLSVVDRFSRVEKRVGVLTEIVDIPGRSKMAKLLVGEKSDLVSLDSLIVLE